MSSRHARLGDRARDEVTGYEGIVICEHTMLNGCIHLELKAPGLTDEMKTKKGFAADIQRIKIIEEDVIKVPPHLIEYNNVRLGDEVEDLVVGLQGIVTGRMVFLSGAVYYHVAQVGMQKDGHPNPDYLCEERTLRVLRPAVVKADISPAAPGGDIAQRPTGCVIGQFNTK